MAFVIKVWVSEFASQICGFASLNARSAITLRWVHRKRDAHSGLKNVTFVTSSRSSKFISRELWRSLAWDKATGHTWNCANREAFKSNALFSRVIRHNTKHSKSNLRASSKLQRPTTFKHLQNKLFSCTEILRDLYKGTKDRTETLLKLVSEFYIHRATEAYRVKVGSTLY